MITSAIKKVLVTGGAGYVGAALVPALLDAGYEVTSLDLYMYGDVLKRHPKLKQVKGDLRDQALLKRELKGVDAVIHLACVSNDPSFELNPDLGKSINFNAFEPLVDIAKAGGAQRFIYASSSSVYGVREEENVTEDLDLQPLTDYSKFKALCEPILQSKSAPGFTVFTVRPATVCGYSARVRLDLTVNVLTAHAYFNRKIKVFGGDQMRPNLHIKDMVRFYLEALKWPAEKIDKKIYNCGFQNRTVNEIAGIVQKLVGPDVTIERTSTDDNRSYRVSSEKISSELGFVPQFTIEDAVKDLVTAFSDGLVPNAMTDDSYYNIRVMKKINLV